MADTERSTSTLLTDLFRDNVAQEISEQDLRDLIVSVLGGYGSVYVVDGATPQAVGATPSKLSQFAANGPALGATPAHASDEITVGVAGVYLVSFDATLSGDAETYTLRLYTNGSAEGSLACAAKLSSSDVSHAGFAGVVSLSGSDVLSIYVEAGSTVNLTAVHACLSIKRIG